MPIAGFFSRLFQENKPLMTAKGCRLIIAHFTHPTATDFSEVNIMWQIHPYSLAMIHLSGQLSPMDGAGAPGETGKFIFFDSKWISNVTYYSPLITGNDTSVRPTVTKLEYNKSKDLYQVQETWKFFFLTHIHLCVNSLF